MKLCPLVSAVLMLSISALLQGAEGDVKPEAAPATPKPVTTPAPVPPLAPKFAAFAAKTFEFEGLKLGYRFYQPAEIKPGEKYPVVLFLHGYGERGDDNRAQMKGFGGDEFWKRHPCFIIAPQCPRQGTGGNTSWVTTNFGALEHTMAEKPNLPLSAVMALLDESLKTLPIDPHRVYVTGLSMGGFGTYELISREPQLFAAAIPICGGADLAQAPKFSKIPLWIFHGGADQTVKTQRSRDLVKKLEELGVTAKYTEYPAWGMTRGRRRTRIPKWRIGCLRRRSRSEWVS